MANPKETHTKYGPDWVYANQLQTKAKHSNGQSYFNHQRYPRIDKPSFTTKSLGILIDWNSSWGNLIDTFVLQLVKRVCSFCSLSKALIQPHFDYCYVVRGNCGMKLGDNLQKLQNPAAQTLTFSTVWKIKLGNSQHSTWHTKGHNGFLSLLIILPHNIYASNLYTDLQLLPTLSENLKIN